MISGRAQKNYIPLKKKKSVRFSDDSGRSERAVDMGGPNVNSLLLLWSGWAVPTFSVVQKKRCSFPVMRHVWKTQNTPPW